MAFWKIEGEGEDVDLGGSVKGVMESSHWAEPETPHDREHMAWTALYGSVYITPKLGEG